VGRFDGGLRVGCARRGRRGRREGGDRSAQGRIGREHAEVAVAVDARRRHQGGQAVEQLERRQDLRAVPARTLLVSLVEQALGIELAQTWRSSA
jgi:hypothetical protein